MSLLSKPGEQVRHYYFKHGERQTKEQIIEALNADAVIQMTLSVEMLERIVKIIEETNVRR